jgi:hypothetical protein
MACTLLSLNGGTSRIIREPHRAKWGAAITKTVLKRGNPIVQVQFSAWTLDSTKNLHRPSNGTTNPETTPGEHTWETLWPSNGTTTPERPRA